MGGETPLWGELSGSPIGVSRGPTSRSAGGGGEGEVVAVVTGRRRRRAPAATTAAASALLDSEAMARRTGRRAERGPRWAQGHRGGSVEAGWLDVGKGRGCRRRGGGRRQGRGRHGQPVQVTVTVMEQKSRRSSGGVQWRPLFSKTAGFKSAEAQPDKWGVQRSWGDVAQRVGGDGGGGARGERAFPPICIGRRFTGRCTVTATWGGDGRWGDEFPVSKFPLPAAGRRAVPSLQPSLVQCVLIRLLNPDWHDRGRRRGKC